MPFDYDDPYVTVGCRIVAVRETSVQIEGEAGEKHWIPRSCLHGGDDIRIGGKDGVEMKLKIRRWKAQSEGLV